MQWFAKFSHIIFIGFCKYILILNLMPAGTGAGKRLGRLQTVIYVRYTCVKQTNATLFTDVHNRIWRHVVCFFVCLWMCVSSPPVRSKMLQSPEARNSRAWKRWPGPGGLVAGPLWSCPRSHCHWSSPSAQRRATHVKTHVLWAVIR